MRIIVQRSLESSVSVDKMIVGKIDAGVVLLIGFSKEDQMEDITQLVQKVLDLRIFNDEMGKMNLSVQDVKGQVLAISQFTLYGDTTKGNRPSFIEAMEYKKAEQYYDLFCQQLRKKIIVETGIFGADMQVSITNDGPVTLILESRNHNV